MFGEKAWIRQQAKIQEKKKEASRRLQDEMIS